MNGIVLHDYFDQADGGGRLALTLARGLGFALCYGFRTGQNPYFGREPLPIPEINLACRSDLPLWRQMRLTRAFLRRTGFVAKRDVAVYSGAYAPLAMLGHAARKNVLYCHTPPRFLFDQRDFFVSRLPFWQRPLLNAFIARLMPLYLEASARMDVVAANSITVRERVRRYLGRDATVVHPPCDTARYQFLGQEGYYLSFGRLDPLKRVDLIVAAFRRMPRKRLLVASGGPELPALRRLAAGADNIEILGPVDDALLRELIGRCVATLYIPREEDFGMTPVESMAAGKPVIGVREGGLTETVVEGETGMLIEPGPSDAMVEALIRAVEAMTTAAALRCLEACRRRAACFDTTVFLRRMRAICAD